MLSKGISSVNQSMFYKSKNNAKQSEKNIKGKAVIMSQRLTPSQKQQIKKIVAELVALALSRTYNSEELGLFNGLAGDLLFLWQAERWQPGMVDQQVFENKFDYLQQNLGYLLSLPTFGRGMLGVSWLIEFINQGQGEDYEPSLCSEIDSLLLQQLAVEHWQGELEMVMGLAGYSVYAARRGKKVKQEQHFKQLLRHFEAASMHISEGLLSWPQPARSVFRVNKQNPEQLEFNLGLAHGMPGIIAALLPALDIEPLQQRAYRLITQSCDWLLQQELPKNSFRSCFASTSQSSQPSRLGWCYGDLTIALTLARAGRKLGIFSYLNNAEQISLCAARRSAQQGMVEDAGLCHGSAGIALIFQLLNKELKQEGLLQAAHSWLNHSLQLYSEKGLKGFWMYSTITHEYQEVTGLLEGYSGVGLALLAALNNDTDWVDSLLMA